MYRIIECSVRTQFEMMANAQSAKERKHYCGTARGLSISLVLLETHRLPRQLKVKPEESELNIEEVAETQPMIYE